MSESKWQAALRIGRPEDAQGGLISATPSGFPFPLTGDAFIDVITTGYKWNLDYTRTINWAIAGFYGEYWKSPATVRHELQHAFDAFSYFANVTFSYTGYFDDPQLAALAGAQMTVSMDGAGLFMSGWNIWACGFFPTTDFDAYYGQPGDVFLNLNSDANYLPSYSPGTTGFALILHELGHALGLKHTHDDGGTGRPTIAELGNEDLDHDWFSIMSYGDDYPWNLLQWHPATPMALDALGLMYLYGPNMSTNAGDSTLLVHDHRVLGLVESQGEVPLDVLEEAEKGFNCLDHSE